MRANGARQAVTPRWSHESISRPPQALQMRSVGGEEGEGHQHEVAERRGRRERAFDALLESRNVAGRLLPSEYFLHSLTHCDESSSKKRPLQREGGRREVSERKGNERRAGCQKTHQVRASSTLHDAQPARRS